jgi:hypothetical protein
MPSPDELIGSFQDDGGNGRERFESAEEFKKRAQREVNRAASERLSPAQQEQLDISFDTEGGDDDQLLMKQYNLLDDRDQYRFEQFAGRDGVSVVSTNMEWTDDNERLIYFVMYHVQPRIYNRMRWREIEDPDLHAIPPETDDSTSSRGRFEAIGYAIDRWIARATMWLSGWF